MLLPAEWEVPAVFRRRLGDRAGRQRAMQADGHLLLVLHKVPQAGVPEREGVLFWRRPEGAWQVSGRGEGVAALRRHIEQFASAVDQLESMYEKSNDAAGYYRVIGAIVPLHRSASHMHATLQAAREMIPDDRELIDLRDRAGEIDRAAELLHADALNAVNFCVAQNSEALARSSHELAVAGHRLNTLATVFLPITAIASLFGMNIVSGLEHVGPWLFWGVLVFAIILGMQLKALLALQRRAKEPRRDDPDEILRSAGQLAMPKEPARRDSARLLAASSTTHLPGKR